MSRFLSAASMLALGASLTLVAGAGSASAQNWPELARQDLQAAHDELAANHPAPAVGGAAGQQFNAWLDTGLQQALAQAGRANSGSSQAYLVRYYAAGFRDANIYGRASYDTPATRFEALSWGGVTTGWRDGRYVVTNVERGTRGAPPIGAAIVSCNGTPIEEYARSKLDLWEGNLNTEAGRVQTAPYLLWNRNNPYVNGVPSLCEYQSGRGRPREFQLMPKPPTAGATEAAFRSTVWVHQGAPLSIETVNGRPWVNVHSFADDAGWDAFNAQLAEQAATLQGPQGFVLDFRGASGSSNLGSSARGYGTVNRIWTPEFAQGQQVTDAEFTYRATPKNREWYAQVVERMQQDARFVYESPQIIAQTQAILARMDQAIAAGEATFVLPANPLPEGTVSQTIGPDGQVLGTAPAAPTGPAANPVQGPVIVLVDSGCGGGCLDTVDLLSRLPNVRIVGSTTPADSVFIEQTNTRLPSNYTDVSYGHKAWLNRPRANNAPFDPQGALKYTGNPLDEAAVRTWVGGLFGA